MNRTASYHIECVAFGTRMAEQKGKVCDPFRVLESHNMPTVADGPVFTLFTEDARARGTDITVRDGRVRVGAMGLGVHEHATCPLCNERREHEEHGAHTARS